MSFNIYQFSSFAELLQYIDAKIGSIESALSQLQQRYNYIKSRAEKIQRLEKVIEELVGEKISLLNEIDFMGLKVVINARAIDELNVLEETIMSQQDLLNALKRIREVIQKLNDSLTSTSGLEGITIMVQTMNDIPIRILLKESEQ
ncbi:MAG: hypothetical protein DRP57_06155 [Spirochaetes bacterium]|nr:MAG: hypothetical protein DRP57_06155 [Spirochaetota bacterium]